MPTEDIETAAEITRRIGGQRPSLRLKKHAIDAAAMEAAVAMAATTARYDSDVNHGA